MTSPRERYDADKWKTKDFLRTFTIEDLETLALDLGCKKSPDWKKGEWFEKRNAIIESIWMETAGVSKSTHLPFFHRKPCKFIEYTFEEGTNCTYRVAHYLNKHGKKETATAQVIRDRQA